MTSQPGRRLSAEERHNLERWNISDDVMDLLAERLVAAFEEAARRGPQAIVTVTPPAFGDGGLAMAYKIEIWPDGKMPLRSGAAIYALEGKDPR